jgi:hypothetical protein
VSQFETAANDTPANDSEAGRLQSRKRSSSATPVDQVPSQRRRKKQKEDHEKDEVEKYFFTEYAKASTALTTQSVFQTTLPSLDVSKFYDPEPPVKIRAFDSGRIETLYNTFCPSSMTPAKLLFLDTNLPEDNAWKSHTEVNYFAQGFNSTAREDIPKRWGMPVVMGGYHSSKAFIKYQREHHPGKPPLRPTMVYRLSQLPGVTDHDKLQLARIMATVDNSAGQATQNYDSQPLIVLTHLWRDIYLRHNRPVRRQLHLTDEWRAFENECCIGSETMYAQLSHANGRSNLIPRWRIASLPDDLYDKMFTIIGSMDSRESIDEVTVSRFEYVETSTGNKVATVEDVKDTMRLPDADMQNFILMVHDDDLVLSVYPPGGEEEDIKYTPKSFTTAFKKTLTWYKQRVTAGFFMFLLRKLLVENDVSVVDFLDEYNQRYQVNPTAGQVRD